MRPIGRSVAHTAAPARGARAQLFWVQFFNQGMLVFGLLGHVVKPYALATALLTLSWISFALLMRLVHDMFLRITLVAKVQLARIENSEQLGPLTDAEAGDPVTGIERGRSAFHQSARTTVRMIRHTHALTLLLWVGFGINDALASSGVVPLSATEEAWSVLDVFAKARLLAAAPSPAPLAPPHARRTPFAPCVRCSSRPRCP